jgi:hypothetical protein
LKTLLLHIVAVECRTTLSKPTSFAISQIKDVIHDLEDDKNIAFVWVSGHCNFQGNETVDKTVKEGTNLKMPSDLKMNTCDLKSKVKRVSLATWQNQ